jgi:excisionase family DNA binding protein
METNQLKLYSLSEAASAMCIGRDTLRKLMSEGQIGYILVGNSKRISYQELVRFQSEKTLYKVEPIISNKFSGNDLGKMFRKRKPTSISKLNSKELLEEIIRRDNNGNNKKQERSISNSMV